MIRPSFLGLLMLAGFAVPLQASGSAIWPSSALAKLSPDTETIRVAHPDVAAFELLQRFPRLSQLNLEWRGVGDEAVDYGYRNGVEATLSGLAQLESIETLNIDFGMFPVAGSELDRIAKLPQLTRLSLTFTSVVIIDEDRRQSADRNATFPAGTLKNWAKTLDLAKLSLDGVELSAQDLADLAMFDNLKVLSLSNYVVPNAALPGQIATLTLGSSGRLTKETTIPDFSKAKSLTALTVRSTDQRLGEEFKNRWISAIAEAPSITSLDISFGFGYNENNLSPRAGLTLADMKALAGMASLKRLHLSCWHMASEGTLEAGALGALVDLSKLEVLALSVEGVTEKHLAELQSHTGIKHLELYQGKFSNVDSFAKGFPALKRIVVVHTAELDREALERERPQLVVLPKLD